MEIPPSTHSEPLYPTQTTPVALAEGISAFLDHLVLNRNVSAHTHRAYGHDLQAFLLWLQPEQPMPQLDNGADPKKSRKASPTPLLQQVQVQLPKDAPQQYTRYLMQKQVARSTIARKRSAIRSLFKYLIREGYLTPEAILLDTPRPKQPKALPEFLTLNDVEQLVSAAQKEEDGPLSRRNVAILYVLFTSGIRVAELIGLNQEDIDWEHLTFRVLGKGDRERIAFFSDLAAQTLRHYLELYDVLWDKGRHGANTLDNGSRPLFINKGGRRLSERSVHRLVAELGQKAGLAKAVHPHLFRHGYATHLLNHGVDLRAVQELLGHVSIRSTQIYTHLTTDRLRQAFLSAHPRATRPGSA